MSRRGQSVNGPTHLIADGGDRRSLCGVKDPLPVVLAAFAQRHVDGYGLVICPGCAERDGRLEVVR